MSTKAYFVKISVLTSSIYQKLLKLHYGIPIMTFKLEEFNYL